MKLILKREFETEFDLRKYIADNKIDMPEFRCAVIGMLFDKDGNVIFQRRGPESRDGSGMLAEIGGAVEDYDKTLKDAMMRELREEVGEKAQINIDDFVGGVLQTKYDSRTKKDVNWLFLLYKCTHVSGELGCHEEGKALGCEVYDINELPEEDMEPSREFFC
ncbi:MAG: NUDIX hydrolase [Bacilli bacterium]|nr:NUDIX hydrolase [Bacilli bacterium]